MTTRTATATTLAAAALAAVPLNAAKAQASRHRAAITASTRCACFFCFRTFPSSSIKAWIDASTTALCPGCGIDAVLGDASVESIADGFLRRMHQYHFGFRSR